MEKSSLAYDISPRFIPKIGSNAKTNERYYDRMTLRGIPVVRDTEDESDKPVWRGDHSFSPDAATYSLMHFIEPEVSREHPEWTPAQVHENAVERFEKRLSQDLSYEHRESNHEESVVTWHPVETSRGTIELATEYGDKMVTLSELWSHTKEYAAFSGNPAAYNNAEHEAQLLMQDKLIHSSSNGFVSVLSHPDAVRYVQVWQKSDTGEIISQQVDLYAATGKDFSPEEAKELIYHLSDFHHERTELPDPDQAYAHFFVAQGVVHADDIRMIAIAQSVYTEDVSYEPRMINFPWQNPTAGVHRSVDVSFVIEKTGQYLRDQIDEKIQSIIRHADISPVRVNPSKYIPKDIGSHPKPPLTEKQKAPKIMSEKAQDAWDVKSVLSEWWISQTILTFVPLLPVAPEAALYWFAVLRDGSAKQVIPEAFLLQEGRLQNNITAGAFMFQRVEDVWKAFVIRLDTSRASAISHHPLSAYRMSLEQPAKGNNQNTAARKEAPRRQMITEQARFVVWYAAAKILSRFFGPISTAQKGRPPKDTRVPILHQPEWNGAPTEEQLIAAGRFMFALMLRWLWAAAPVEALIQDKKPVCATSADIKQPAESTSWVLLSIIWYLSMIRESGTPGTYTAPQQKNPRPKRKRKKVTLPESGVIFTLAS